jgi:DNA-directed RNA polymerase subunit RPC12/RpoP
VHDLATAEDQSYEWPRCVACSKDLWADETNRWACRPCQDRTGKRLAELPGLFARVNSTAALVRGSRRGTGMPTGSRVPPIPANAEVLNLAAAGGVATRLQVIEDAWRQTLGWTVTPWRGNAGQSLPKQIEFLTNNLGWACERYEEVGQDIEEVRRLHAECTGALSPDSKPGRVRIGLCPVVFDSGRCAAQLTATTANHKVRCPKCLTEWPDLGAWRELRRAQEAAEGVMAA